MTLLPPVKELRRLRSPAPAPQALAFHEGTLWMGSRDLRRVYALNPNDGAVRSELAAPGIPWAAVATGETLRFTLGEGADDDRYIRGFVPGKGFGEERIACPEYTGSYLSYDGKDLYLSQWYEHRILQVDGAGAIRRTINVGAEICGHVFRDGFLYVLRGTEQEGEHWTIAKIDPRETAPAPEDLARVPFACRSLAWDGENFWSNHRAAGEIVSFALP
ncbi:MAG: hypothetical protein M3Z22_04050 [Verrucomicrobiota bacterium]|nr:hypothetical protein [Verrucomicrobiota bacterium]